MSTPAAIKDRWSSSVPHGRDADSARAGQA